MDETRHGAMRNQCATVTFGSCQHRTPCRVTSAQCRAFGDNATAAQGAGTAQLPTLRSLRSTVCTAVPTPSAIGTATTQHDPSMATAQGGGSPGPRLLAGAALRVATPSQAHTLPAHAWIFASTPLL